MPSSSLVISSYSPSNLTKLKSTPNLHYFIDILSCYLIFCHIFAFLYIPHYHWLTVNKFVFVIILSCQSLIFINLTKITTHPVHICEIQHFCDHLVYLWKSDIFLKEHSNHLSKVLSHPVSKSTVPTCTNLRVVISSFWPQYLSFHNITIYYLVFHHPIPIIQHYIISATHKCSSLHFIAHFWSFLYLITCYCLFYHLISYHSS